MIKTENSKEEENINIEEKIRDEKIQINEIREQNSQLDCQTEKNENKVNKMPKHDQNYVKYSSCHMCKKRKTVYNCFSYSKATSCG